jgi:hypothetical protein
MKSPWNKSNSSVVGSGVGSGGSLIGRSSTVYRCPQDPSERPVRINYKKLHELNYQESVKLKIRTS